MSFFMVIMSSKKVNNVLLPRELCSRLGDTITQKTAQKCDDEIPEQQKE